MILSLVQKCKENLQKFGKFRLFYFDGSLSKHCVGETRPQPGGVSGRLHRYGGV